MNRREFIGSSVAAFASPFVFGAEKLPMTVSGKHLPSWAFEQIAEGLERFRAWKGRDEVISFPMTTDCHSRYYALSDNYFDWNDTESEVKAKAKVETANLAFEGEPNWDDPKVHTLFMRYIAHGAGSDFIADLGDHDFEYFVFRKPMPMPIVDAGIKAYRKLYEGEDLPTIFARGNHDHSKGRISDATYGEIFNRSLNVGKKCALTLSEDGTFGYLDLPAKKFRAIFLNTSRGYKNGLFQDELQFLADTLRATPDGWQTILIEHIPVMTLHHWHRSMNADRDPNMQVAYSMLDSYANRRGDFVIGWRADTEKNICPLQGGGSVRWCFKDVRSVFAGAFFGHEHVADFVHYGKVPLVTRPGYGTIPTDCIAGEMIDVKKGRSVPNDMMLIDLVAIKPAKHETHIFRFGLGGASADLAYQYG